MPLVVREFHTTTIYPKKPRHRLDKHISMFPLLCVVARQPRLVELGNSHKKIKNKKKKLSWVIYLYERRLDSLSTSHVLPFFFNQRLGK